MKIHKIMTVLLIITTLNFWVFTINCSPIPKEKLGPNDWYQIWSSPKLTSCYDMMLDSDNNIYLTGYTYLSQNPLDYDMLLIKYQNISEYFISTTWNLSMYDRSYAMARDSSNNIYIAGISGNYSNTDYTLVKFDNNLNYQWNRTWGLYKDNRCFSVAIDSQDSIYLGGHVMQETGHYNVCLVKYNSSGDFQWYNTWSYYLDNYCFAIAIDLSDNVYLTGRTKDYTNNDLCLLKYNSSGDLQWSKIREAPSYEIGLGIKLDSQENIFITGETNSDISPNVIETFLVKYTKDGIFEWDKIYSGDRYCFSTDIAIDSSDNIYIGGVNKLTNSNGPSASIIKYDNNGTLQWHIEWGEPYIDSCRAIAIDSMNNFLIAGEISAWEYQLDGFFIVQNPKTKVKAKLIIGFPIIQILILTSLGLLILILKKIRNKLKLQL